MGSRVIGTGNKENPVACYLQECVGDRGSTSNLTGVIGGTDQHEIVHHHWHSFQAEPVSHERFLGGGGVDEQHVSIATTPEFEGLTTANSDDLDLDPGFLLEERDQHVQQTAVLGAGGGRQSD